MDAIILAAGCGKRLREFNPDGRPKSLLEFGGKSLLARELQYLAESGVRRVELVVGYEADQVIEHVGALDRRPEVSFAFNPHYLDGSVISLLSARECLLSGNEVLVMDANVLFHPRILQRLVQAERSNLFLFDAALVPGDEAVGFFRFDAAACADIAAACARYQAEGLSDAPHEEVLRELWLAKPERFASEDVSGLPWLAVDFPGDIERAVKRVLPAIRADYPEF